MAELIKLTVGIYRRERKNDDDETSELIRILKKSIPNLDSWKIFPSEDLKDYDVEFSTKEDKPYNHTQLLSELTGEGYVIRIK